MHDDSTVLLDLPVPPHQEFHGEFSDKSVPESIGDRSGVIENCSAFIHEPHDSGERLRFLQVKNELMAGDGFAAAAQLVIDTAAFGGPYQLLPCYCLAIVAVDACTAAGVRVHGDDHLLRIIRSQVRNELARLPAHGTVEWIIPATPAERTAAHVAALLSARLGTIARPWLWPMIPAYGRFTVLGKPGTVSSMSDHHRCHGQSTFHAIAERLHQIG